MFEEPITGAKGVDIEASKRNWAREDASWKSSERFYGQGVVNMERRNKDCDTWLWPSFRSPRTRIGDGIDRRMIIMFKIRTTFTLRVLSIGVHIYTTSQSKRS